MTERVLRRQPPRLEKKTLTPDAGFRVKPEFKLPVAPGPTGRLGSASPPPGPPAAGGPGSGSRDSE